MVASKAPATTAALIEPAPKPTEFISGAACVHRTGNVTFMVFYVDRVQPSELSHAMSREIAQRFAMPNDAADRLARMLQIAGERPGLAVGI